MLTSWREVATPATSTSKEDDLRIVYRNYGYLLSVLTGAAIGFASNPDAISWYGHVVSRLGLLWILLTIAFVLLSSEDPDKRAKRLVKCAVVSVATVPFALKFPFDYDIGSYWKLDLLDVFSFLFAVIVTLSSVRPILRATARHQKSPMQMIPAYAIPLASVVGVVVSILHH